MNDRFYYLSAFEHSLLSFYHLDNFCKWVSCGHTFYGNFVIPYDCFDALARAVYALKNKRGKDYKKLVSFVDRLQEVLELNETC